MNQNAMPQPTRCPECGHSEATTVCRFCSVLKFPLAAPAITEAERDAINRYADAAIRRDKATPDWERAARTGAATGFDVSRGRS